MRLVRRGKQAQHDCMVGRPYRRDQTNAAAVEMRLHTTDERDKRLDYTAAAARLPSVMNVAYRQTDGRTHGRTDGRRRSPPAILSAYVTIDTASPLVQQYSAPIKSTPVLLRNVWCEICVYERDTLHFDSMLNQRHCGLSCLVVPVHRTAAIATPSFQVLLS